VRTLKLLWGSPLPPTRSGIADYAAELLPHLARRTEVAVLEPPDWEPLADSAWLSDVKRLPWDVPAPPGFVPILHLGNNPYHLWVVRRLRRFGGVAVLHDSVLGHLLVEEAAADGKWERFAQELGESHGTAGSALAAGRRWGYSGPLDPFLYPARGVYLRHASAVVVHTRLAESEVAFSCPGLPVRRVPLAVAEPVAGDRQAWRGRLGVNDRELLLAHLGFLTPAKGLDVILHSLAALSMMGVGARLVVVGEGSEAGSFETAVAAAGLESRVRVWGYASDVELGGILAAADLGLVPRYPTAGETSAAALRFFAAGRPVAVAGYRQFLELPREAAFRIAPGRAGWQTCARGGGARTDEQMRARAGAASGRRGSRRARARPVGLGVAGRGEELARDVA
jgi:glycosyltransferase involved in cell wall biosynthesis